MVSKLKEHIPSILDFLKQGDTYNEIANVFGVSRERIRQIAKKHGLHGHGKQQRKEEKENTLHEKLKRKFGQFYKDGVVEKSDFLSVCKIKYSTKKAQVGKAWKLEFSDIQWNTHCPIFGIELNYFAETRQENSPSFDRIDPNKGYVPGNVQIVSWRANRIKNDGTSKEHFLIAEYLKNLGY